MDLDDTAARLGVSVADADRAHRLAGDRLSAPLPAKADAPAILGRLAVRPDDAAEIMAAWPDPGFPAVDPGAALAARPLDRPDPRRSRRPRLAAAWPGAAARGGVYELGRLQYQRDSTAIGLHIPESGPFTPQAVTASLDEARAFFPRHFPDEHYTTFSCGSWLLDPQLLDYLPRDSNIASFQRRFELEPYQEPEGLDADVEVLRFVFRTLTTPLDQLPRRTVLQRAIADHLKAGRHWYWRRGHFPI